MSSAQRRNHLNGAVPRPPIGIGAPRLPGPPLRGFDRVTDLTLTGGIYGSGGASARAGLARQDWAFSCHFEGDPVLPGMLMVDALLQLVGVSAGAVGFVGRGRAVRVNGVRFLREVTPACGYVDYRIAVRRLHHRK